MEAPVVKLGALEVTLARPSALAALALGRDAKTVEGSDGSLLLALGAAALACCWPAGTAWPARIPPRPWRAGQRMEDYGQAVFEALADAGVDIVEIIRAGGDAYSWAMASRLTQKRVDEAASFSEAPAAGG